MKSLPAPPLTAMNPPVSLPPSTALALSSPSASEMVALVTPVEVQPAPGVGRPAVSEIRKRFWARSCQKSNTSLLATPAAAV
jgi:hypothetical protein